MVKSVFLVLVNVLIGAVAALYLTVRLTLYALLIYFNCAFIIPFTLRHLSGLFTSLNIIGSFGFNNIITVVN